MAKKVPPRGEATVRHTLVSPEFSSPKETGPTPKQRLIKNFHSVILERWFSLIGASFLWVFSEEPSWSNSLWQILTRDTHLWRVENPPLPSFSLATSVAPPPYWGWVGLAGPSHIAHGPCCPPPLSCG